MVNFKAFIFDLDGVLVDTAKYHYLAWEKLASGLGFDFTEEQNEQLKGIGRKESLEILLNLGGIKAGEKEKQRLANEKNEHYLLSISEMSGKEVLPGVNEFLEEVKSQGYKVVLGSVSKNAQLILQKTELEEYFDAVIDGNKIKRAKPAPDVFLRGAVAVGVQPSKCLVFEDAVAGIQAAVSAGMKNVGIGDPKILFAANVVIPGFKGMTVSDLLKMF